MGVEEILLEAAAAVENEYEKDDDFEDDDGEKGDGVDVKKGEDVQQQSSNDENRNDVNANKSEQQRVSDVSAALKKAVGIVDEEDQYDARESFQYNSKMLKLSEDGPIVSSRELVDDDDSIGEKLRKADAKTDIIPDTESKMEEKQEDSESDYESDDDEGDYDEMKEFFYCCYHRRINEIIKHLDKGASIHTKDRHGWTPLHWACAKGFDDVLGVLLKEYRGDVKKCINQRDHLMGFTPLHLACIGGHVECIDILFDYKAKRLKNNVGELPIDVIGVNLTSELGRKIGKIFGLDPKSTSEAKSWDPSNTKSSKK